MKHDVIIIGGGVSGTALLYTLSKYSNVRSIGLIEKYSDFGLVNTASTMNSQTLHFGDIETNYTLEKARKVKRSADMVIFNYLLKNVVYDIPSIGKRSFLKEIKKIVPEIRLESCGGAHCQGRNRMHNRIFW